MISNSLIVLIESCVEMFEIVDECSKLCSLLLGEADSKGDLLTTLSQVGEESVGDDLVQKMHAFILFVSGALGAQIR
jgi:hypothetical protein